MSEVVWKAVINLEAPSFSAPSGAVLLMADEQHGEICVWFRCDPTAPKQTRHLKVVGTGHAGPLLGRYIGSAKLQGGMFVFHVFE
jgi:hypothetical protein